MATPAWDHYKQTIELLEQGKNLYVEKPLALTKEECVDIKSKIKDNQTLMVGHIFLKRAVLNFLFLQMVNLTSLMWALTIVNEFK